MKKLRKRWIFGGSSVIIALASATLVWAQLPLDPIHTAGNNVTPAYEGWYEMPDGTFNILVGYYNRNTKESIDIPVGPNNHLDPGGPDIGQPTHFLPGRQWGVFTINVPKDFAPPRELPGPSSPTANRPPSRSIWTLSIMSRTFKDATNNTPPFLGWAEAGPFVQGPPIKISQTYTATVGEPLSLSVWGGDDNIIPPGARIRRRRWTRPRPKHALHRNLAQVPRARRREIRKEQTTGPKGRIQSPRAGRFRRQCNHHRYV